MIKNKSVVIVGAGPSGLMAAEILAKAGLKVSIYDRMPNPARKFLMAGRGGLNLTHSEPLEQFTKRYGKSEKWISHYINEFTPQQLREWCENLGQETYVGSSGRVFPRSMKAAPLLRAWLKRLEELGVKFFGQHYWNGWENDALKFTKSDGQKVLVQSDAVLLALGGASWPRLGSDGNWLKILSEKGIEISPLRPANSGFITTWSKYFSDRFAGTPLKSISLTHGKIACQGEALITAKGIEGGAIYAISSSLRDSIEKNGSAILQIDLRPSMTVDELAKKFKERGNQSLSTYLKKSGFAPIAISLLHETNTKDDLAKITAENLAVKLKTLAITLTATTGLERAISTAGGIEQKAVNKNFMLNIMPGIFVAGEMLDWEAPTGGYLLQACFSTAVAAANGILEYLEK